MEKVILIIIATINPSEKEALAYYMEQMKILYTEVGAVPVKKYKIDDTLIGDEEPNIISIIEFPSEDAIEKVFKSSRYSTLISFRDKAFKRVEAHLAKK